MLSCGYYLIVDNCTVHDNIGLEETILDMFNIKLAWLPAYHWEFNPMELIFQVLFKILRANRARFTALSNNILSKPLYVNKLYNFDLLDIVKKYMP